MRAVIDLTVPVKHSKVLGYAVNRALEWLGPDPTLRSLGGFIRAKQWDRVLATTESLETQEYSGVLDQYVKTQLVALVKKFPWTADEVPGMDPERAAWKKFLAAEHRCRRVNQRAAILRYGVGFPYGELISLMKGYIRQVIGRKPDYSKIYALCDWGPGANVGVTGDRTGFARKFLASQWTVTPLALSDCISALWSNDQLRLLILRGEGPVTCLDPDKFRDKVRERIRLVDHNNVSFVPKSWKTHRSIATEPLLNGYLQKGIDQYMRQRLAAVGIDLKHQEPNQLMARLGSEGGSNPYATLDLSSASDSLSIGTARTLLPSAWYDFLDRVRSHRYRYRGQTHVYHKFVSMGNGFCFPLQTLVFAAACHAISTMYASTSTEGNVTRRFPFTFRVYGDDIIVRQNLAPMVIELLRYLGFRVNSDKTFIFGPFRESCGTDWYSGLDIRPVYMDYRLDSNVSLYKFHNATLRSDLTMAFFEGLRPILREQCPPTHRFVRPVHGNPDSCFTVGVEEARRSQFVAFNRDTWAYRWTEVETRPFRDLIYPYDSLCSELEYLSVLRGASSSCPTAVRRKTRAVKRRKSYHGLPGHLSWVGADPIRPERG